MYLNCLNWSAKLRNFSASSCPRAHSPKIYIIYEQALVFYISRFWETLRGMPCVNSGYPRVFARKYDPREISLGTKPKIVENNGSGGLSAKMIENSPLFTLMVLGRVLLDITHHRVDARVLGTKYLYIKSTTVYVPSSELGLSHPFSRQRVCPSARFKGGGGTLACGWGGGGVPIPTTGEKA
jgi:hypothetical protein